MEYLAIALLATTFCLGVFRHRHRYLLASLLGLVSAGISISYTGEVCVVLGMVPIYMMLAGLGVLARDAGAWIARHIGKGKGLGSSRDAHV